MSRPLKSLLTQASKRPRWTVFIVAAAIHAGAVGLVWYQTGSIAGYAFQSLDCHEYYRIARNLAEHGVFSRSEAPPWKPDTWRTPGYPLFLAAWMRLVSDSPAALVLMQQLVAVLAIMVFYEVMATWVGGERALIGAVLLTLEPYGIYYSFWLMPTSLFTGALACVWLCWERLGTTDLRRWAVGLGITAGACVLFWPGAILLPATVLLGLMGRAVWVPGRESRRPRRGLFARPAIVALTAALVIGAWMWRNQAVAGHFALSDQRGVVMAYFKATEVILWREGRTRDRFLETSLDPRRSADPHSVWEGIDADLRSLLSAVPSELRPSLHWKNLAQGNQSPVDPFIVSDALNAIALGELLASPGSTLFCSTVRCLQQLIFPLDLAFRPPSGVPAHRVRWLITAIPYVVLVALAVIGLFRPSSRGSWRWFPVPALLALMLTTTPQIDPRFRVPMIPLLLGMALVQRGVARLT